MIKNLIISKNIVKNLKLPTGKTFHHLSQTFTIFKTLPKYFSNKTNEKHNISDQFPKFDKQDFYDEQDLIINVGAKDTFKGLLVICPTPIGNLNDISIRQYEALKNGDLIACEDTRKTGKLLELIKVKKMKEKFYAEFSVSFEEFVNRGGMDMTDEQIKKEFGEKSNTSNEESNIKEDNYHNFYENKEDLQSEKKFEERKKKGSKINKSIYMKQNENEKEKEKSSKSTDKQNKSRTEMFHESVLNKIKTYKQKPETLHNIVSEIKSNFSEEDVQQSLENLKKNANESVKSKFFSAITDKEDFQNKKKIIENSQDDIKDYIDPIAEQYDDAHKLSYKLRTRAKFIMGLSKKLDDDKDDNTTNSPEEELDLNEGLENNYFSMFKKSIQKEKKEKGRGLLIPFNQDNEDKKIPKLIRAMKLGLRVILVSDAGTPTISDPGYKLVKEVAKNGIIVEPIPGPSAVITALSASALPTDKFLFVGYLSKSSGEKKEKLEEIKKIGVTTVIFEAPHRIKQTLETVGEIFGINHEIYLGFELTKRFENHMHGKIENIIKLLEEKEEIKGEITMILAPFKKSQDEIDSENSLNDEVNIKALDFAKKAHSLLNLPDRQMRDLLVGVFNISTKKASKIINEVKNRESSLKTFVKKTSVRDDPIKIRKQEEMFLHEKEEKKLNVKVIKHTHNQNKNI
jgi:16S rRNA (cytidine1402-2'-O)-methyltransferase